MIGAPECYAPYTHEGHTQVPQPITWAADIWSLGCIFSEAAIWIADGYKGLVQYRRQRMAETDRILFKSGDRFHDGERVLQSVLDCHKDIEDRLRRSDYITKEVLDAMVNEMLWEEDRPNAKALIRKADMVLLKARNKLSRGQFSKSSSRQDRSLPRYAPPTAPLPPIPRGLTPGLASIADRKYPTNVENWRSQVTRSQISGTQLSASGNGLVGPGPFRQPAESVMGSVSDLDKELNGSIASWQLGENASVASPITTFTSPHVSVHYDQDKQAANEGRVRVFRSQSNNSDDSQRPHNPQVCSKSQINFIDIVASEPVAAPLSILSDVYTHDEETCSAHEFNANRNSVLGELQTIDETKALGRATSRASSRHSSSGNSISTRQSIHQDCNPSRPDDLKVPVNSQKRVGGFSLFPPKTHEGSSVTSSLEKPPSAEKTFFNQDRNCSEASVPRSNRSISDKASVLSSLPPEPSSMEFLSLNTCLEWKKAHKKVKKHSKVPPVPGQDMNDRGIDWSGSRMYLHLSNSGNHAKIYDQGIHHRRQQLHEYRLDRVKTCFRGSVLCGERNITRWNRAFFHNFLRYLASQRHIRPYRIPREEKNWWRNKHRISR